MSSTDDIIPYDPLAPRKRRRSAAPAIAIVIAFLVIFWLVTAALANDLTAPCDKLRDAVTRYDVNVSIKPENVKRWNEVIRASRAMRKAAGCKVLS